MVRYLSYFCLGLAIALLPGVLYHADFLPEGVAFNLKILQILISLIAKGAVALTFVFSDSPLGDYQGLAIAIFCIVLIGGLMGFQPWLF